jgi:raffinose/stachyose/melibiose transport system permease protein
VEVKGSSRNSASINARKRRFSLAFSMDPRKVKVAIMAYVFILPTFVFIALFSYEPAIRALVGAFTQWDGFSPPTWTGLSNFIQLFHDATFIASLRHIALWAIVGIPIGLISPFIVAILVYRLRSARAQYWYRFFLVMTMMLPPVVGLLIWSYFYNSNGIINILLRLAGLGRYTTTWLLNPHTALWALILLGFPWISVFNLLVFYAGLQAIPTELVDAAVVDGVTSWQRVRHLEIPMVMGQIKLLLILSIVGVTQNLLTPLLMTNGGPGISTVTPVLYMYQSAIDYDQISYGMAIAFIIFLFAMVLALIGMKYFRVEQEEVTS